LPYTDYTLKDFFGKRKTLYEFCTGERKFTLIVNCVLEEMQMFK